ncbi:Methyltransferase domain-containing protein [Enhydrobacter aerosaccus]|uniref:Methyltransferase domain-containing protein n=1 Tax=Enhydrobacter aerosaccus TaxID=225324 RepID=A0A1T4K9X2_9HYPH|nr:class I SAM-dependent methyltransferase [Enhydrobacter aerosaccus]SJZ39248.1 Methyltransferase domain-containing protein [Enhydrobacter aerosaccus]
MKPAEFDRHAEGYDGGFDNPVKRLMGRSADQFIAVKARWLLRHEKGLRDGTSSLLDYGCGAGDLMRVLVGLGARAPFAGCDVSQGMLEEALRRWPMAAAPLPRLETQRDERTPFADGQFDIVVASAVLHHVPVSERPAVYRELGRVLRPGGRLVVFEHNPRNPLVRHVIARTPIDANAILLDAQEVRHGLLDSARYDLETDYLMFTPPALGFLRGIDRLLAWLPLGAQYAVCARKLG